MQISKPIFLACVATAILLPPVLQAQEDTEAQIKARQALEQALKELDSQSAAPAPEAQTPAPAAPATLSPEPAKPKVQPPVQTPPPVVPAPVIAAPALAKEVQPKGPRFEPLPETASNGEIEKAREALRQKMKEMEQQPGAPVFQALPPAVNAPESTPAVVAGSATTAEPVFQPVPVTTPSEADLAAKKKLDEVMALKAAQARSAGNAVASQSPAAFPALQAPPTGLTAGKEQRLQELLQLYKADAVSPDEYHSRRARILAEP